jgi:ubiquinol-cytochrome c reductase cytochrome c subunit
MIPKSGDRFSEKIMLKQEGKPDIMRMVRVLGPAALAAGLVFGAGAALAADAAKGKAAYMKFGCWQCHGTEGQGSAITSQSKVLAPDPLPLEAFVKFVRSTNRAMPPYSEQILSDQDLGDMHAYLSTIPKGKDYKSIPLLDQMSR